MIHMGHTFYVVITHMPKIYVVTDICTSHSLCVKLCKFRFMGVCVDVSERQRDRL